MKLERYLIINRDRSVRLTVNMPNISVREIAARVVIDISDSFFSRPIPVVAITFPEPNPDPHAIVHTTAVTVAEALGIELASVEDALADLVAANGEQENDDEG